jgi:hypothetical protein
LEAEVSREPIDSNPRIVGREPLQPLERPVAAAIVCEKQFPAISVSNPIKDLREHFVKRLDVRLFVVDWDNYGEELHDRTKMAT